LNPGLIGSVRIERNIIKRGNVGPDGRTAISIGAGQKSVVRDNHLDLTGAPMMTWGIQTLTTSSNTLVEGNTIFPPANPSPGTSAIRLNGLNDIAKGNRVLNAAGGQYRISVDTAGINAKVLDNYVTSSGPKYGMPTGAGVISETRSIALTSADIALSGWGTGAFVSPVSATDSRGSFVVNVANADGTANPTITITFKEGSWGEVPIATVMHSGGTALLNVAPTWTAASTTLTITFPLATPPPAGTNYQFTFVITG
jgi:hypothetical protein